MRSVCFLQHLILSKASLSESPNFGRLLWVSYGHRRHCHKMLIYRSSSSLINLPPLVVRKSLFLAATPRRGGPRRDLLSRAGPTPCSGFMPDLFRKRRGPAHDQPPGYGVAPGINSVPGEARPLSLRGRSFGVGSSLFLGISPGGMAKSTPHSHEKVPVDRFCDD